MKTTRKHVLYMLLFTGLFLLLILLMQPVQIAYFRDKIGVLFPKGVIGREERNLLFVIQALMLVVIVPVYALTFLFSWIYRADNPQGKYDPELTDNTAAECLWWGIPCVIVLIIGVITAVETERLDPFKSLSSPNEEMTIQVVALQWKWLFIYPKEKIATLNVVRFPKETPIRFELTADAPMNSFWIPHLGGQIYAMPKMTTLLNLIADEEGEYRGSSANISGEGFAGMTFVAAVSGDEEFRKWVEEVRTSAKPLDLEEYDRIAQPGPNNGPEVFRLKEETLFEHVVNKKMYPTT